jgi:glycine/serine hydroxymethyltransferase
MNEKEMTRVADLCVAAINISKRIQAAVGKKLVDFEKAL